MIVNSLKMRELQNGCTFLRFNRGELDGCFNKK